MKLIISPRPTAPPFPPFSASGGRRLSSFHVHITKKTTTIQMRAIPARDLVIDFGKHKGKMLGTLSSEYLKWMSKNLITGDFEKWGKLAEDVLEDEVYKDRMEWEVAERLLSGEGMEGWSGSGVAVQLEETSKRFGWDYDDKVGWSKVDFGLLGTSKGGRLPRVNGTNHQQQDEENNFRKPAGKECSGGDRREKRRERAAKKRGKQTIVNRNLSNEEEEEEEINHNHNDTGRKEEDKIKMDNLRFPGRQSLLNKVLIKKQSREIS